MQSLRSRKQLLAAALAVGSISFLAGRARADLIISSFTPGDIVVLRGGDSTNSNNPSTGNAFNGQVSSYLDEYTTSGTYVGTIPVGAGVTLPGYGSVSHEGGLNLSVDGHFLSFAGYATSAGATPRNTDGTQTVKIGVIGNAAASLNTTTTITPAQGTGQFVRAAQSINGNQFYVAGKFPAGATAASGLQYVSGVGGSATVTTLQGTVDWRNVTIANNTLFGGTGSSSVGVHGGYQIGTAGTLPTAATPSNALMTNYSGGQSASNLAVLNVATSDSSALSQNGLNSLYTIGDQTTSGITKYYFDGTTWQHANFQVALNATNVVNPTGLIATIDPANSSWVDLFISGQNGIYSYIDKSGDPLSGIAANSFSLIATPGSDGGFYGLAMAPTPAPEPATIGLAGLAGLRALSRRRRGR